MKNSKRRKSVVEDGKSNLKQKFAQRRRSECVTGQTVKLLRSQSVGIETDGSVMGSNESLPTLEEYPGRTRRRRPQSANEMSDMYDSQLDVNSNSTKAVNRMRDQDPPGKESMAERMQRRRRTRVSMEEMPTTTQPESVSHRIRSRRQNEDSDTPVSRYQGDSAAESAQEEVSGDRTYRRRRRTSHQSTEELSRPGPNATDAAKSDVEGLIPRRRRPSRDESARDTDITDDDTAGQRGHYRRRRGSNDSHGSRDRPSLPSSPPPVGLPLNYRTRSQSASNVLFEDGTGSHHQRGSRASSPGRSSDRSSPEPPPRPNLPPGFTHNQRIRGTPHFDSAPIGDDTDCDTDTPSKIHYREALRKFSRAQSSMFDQHIPMKANRDVGQERKPDGRERVRERPRERNEAPVSDKEPPPWRSRTGSIHK